MDFSLLVDRPALQPGEARLPWGDPDFAVRMLAEHLDDSHDLASRRPVVIDRHVALLDELSQPDRDGGGDDLVARAGAPGGDHCCRAPRRSSLRRLDRRPHDPDHELEVLVLTRPDPA